eukprot:TRINITY_DN17989_c0_g2_i1.p1 TRINITY_DN17989_c0_g2~~TRINITY_DN17989_c0_g2_i1.p1  ORF type:complete len:826 (-),score=109.04 TRINITY_DN17989_c0_g2_i1:237-2714(-)
MLLQGMLAATLRALLCSLAFVQCALARPTWPPGPTSPTICEDFEVIPGRGLTAHCDGIIKDGPSKSFSIVSPMISNVTAFELITRVEVKDFVKALDCHEDCNSNDTRLTAMVGYGRSFTPLYSASEKPEIRGGYVMTASLTCFPMPVWEPTRTNVSLHVMSSTPMEVKVTATTRIWLDALEGLLPVKIGGAYHGNYALIPFHIKDAQAGLERVHIDKLLASFGDIKGEEVFNAYIFNENNSCISPRLKSSGCANPEEIVNCLQEIDVDFSEGVDLIRVGQHLSFLKNSTVTISKASVPPRSVGWWFVLVSCSVRGYPDMPCRESRLLVTNEPEDDLEPVLKGWALMILVPAVMLAVIDLTYYYAYKLLLRFSDDGESACKLWPAFVGAPDRDLLAQGWSFLVGRLRSPEPFLAPLLALMMAGFLSTAGQFVVTHWWFMERTGDRDTCFYNEACYYPSFGISIPINHMLSHIPYFIAGFHLIYQVSFAHKRVQAYCKAYPEKVVKYPLDLRPFYAVAASFMAEGIGSACYHVCPSVETFQFDTCFMIPIAHLCSLALVDWPRGPESHTTALKYFLYIITPIWMFNFMGTWYDIDAVPVTGGYVYMYYAFAGSVIVWSLLAVRSFDYIFCNHRVAMDAALAAVAEESMSGSASEEEVSKAERIMRRGRIVSLVLKLVTVPVIVISMVSPSTRAALGGMANVFLLLSVVVMLVVVAWQVETLSIASRRFGASIWWRTVVKLSYLLLLFPLTYAALWCFQEHVALVNPGVSAADSREANQACVVSIFDLHDVWHLLGAVGLAMFGMMLLDVKIHTFARMNSLGVIDESD